MWLEADLIVIISVELRKCASKLVSNNNSLVYFLDTMSTNKVASNPKHFLIAPYNTEKIERRNSAESEKENILRILLK